MARLGSTGAQVLEGTTLLVLVLWACLVAYDVLETELQDAVIWKLCLVMSTIGVTGTLATLHAQDKLPRQVLQNSRSISRKDGGAGISIGCVVPPLVLFTRLIASLKLNGDVPVWMVLYAWTSATASASAYLRYIVFRSDRLDVALLIDGVLLPIIGAMIGVENDLKWTLPLLTRFAISLLVKKGMATFPRSFTLGEALMVSQGIAIFALDAVIYFLFKLVETSRLQAIPIAIVSWAITPESMHREDYVRALHVGMLGSLIVAFLLQPILRQRGTASPMKIARPLPFIACGAFTAITTAAIYLILLPWIRLLLGQEYPFIWLAHFILNSTTRVQLCMFWIAGLSILIPTFAIVIYRFQLRTIIARKLFHFLAVVLFIPAYYADVPMLSLSYGAALSVFVVVECIRAVSFPPVGQHIAYFLQTFVDDRDVGKIILTHSYLLVGCALPLWLSPFDVGSCEFVANAGIVSCVGDAMGAIVGVTYGKRKVCGSKTEAGTIAIFLTLVVASVLFQLDVFFSYKSVGLVLASLLTTAMEVSTLQIDNLVLPLCLFCAITLVNIH